jgi:hypothetical protein
MSTGSQQIERFCIRVWATMSPEHLATAGGPDVLPNPVPAPDPEPPKPDPTPEPSPVSPVPEPAPAFRNGVTATRYVLDLIRGGSFDHGEFDNTNPIQILPRIRQSASNENTSFEIVFQVWSAQNYGELTSPAAVDRVTLQFPLFISEMLKISAPGIDLRCRRY